MTHCRRFTLTSDEWKSLGSVGCCAERLNLSTPPAKEPRHQVSPRRRLHEETFRALLQRSHRVSQVAAYLLRFSLFAATGVDTSMDWLLISRLCLSPPPAPLPALASFGHTHVTSSFAKNAARQPCKPEACAHQGTLAQTILAALHYISCPLYASELSLSRAAVMTVDSISPSGTS